MILIKKGSKSFKSGLKKGFSLIEMLFVMSMMSILVGYGAQSFVISSEKVKQESFKSEAFLLVNKIKEIKDREGFIPYFSYTSVKNNDIVPINEEYEFTIPYQIFIDYKDRVLTVEESEFGEENECFLVEIKEVNDSKKMVFDSCQDTKPHMVY